MVEWSQDVPTDGSIELPPDPSTLDAIGRNHSMETALADLVDNSIDAGATHVLIQIVKVGGRPRSLYIVDNGHGMTPTTIDTAMTVGHRREYRERDLGHFGLGLKAASFSQARSLTVMSKAAGHDAVGRRWRLDDGPQRGFACDVVPGQFASEEFKRNWQIPIGESGTVIRWDDVVSFAATNDPKNVEKILNHTITTACQHLGMVFHRFLEDDKISVEFQVHDVDLSFVGPPVPVTPLNPFGYARPARPDFPKTLTAHVDGLSLAFRCHLWPGRSSSAQFMLTGNPVDHQGLYFYRRGRLLQAGGWVGVHAPHRRLALARVEVEIGTEAIGLFQFNPEKSRVLVGPEFAMLASAAQSSDGMTLAQYFEVAEDVFRAANKRAPKRTAMIHPGTGLPPRLRSTIENEIPQVLGEKPIDIRWDTFPDDSFFRVDRDEHTLWLNKRYRKMLLGGKHGGLNDLPLLKSLLYLLIGNVFEGDYLGPRDKDNIDLWQAVLTTAVQAERQ
ncbi:ATP-binding protein [Amycolatopsis pittospori]|uniref:ATP-binding protein n=1 Tax=Amycolatopsis pittospori TaxID=2749434 RepID=UPI0015EFFBF0|nr:ATP-binding protein [Amycolatopsis pittospori]